MAALRHRHDKPTAIRRDRERETPQMPLGVWRMVLVAALLLGLARCAQAQRIGDLQGASHRSPLADTRVDHIAGIVTAVERDGFWMQDTGDGNPLSSDAIYVFRGRRLGKPRVGDAVTVSGQVQEFRPGGAAGANNLGTTRIDASGAAGAFAGWSRVSSGNRLPDAIEIGAGFLPPTAIAPPVGFVETHPGYRLRPAAYAIDFFEALEGMRVVIPCALTTGPRTGFGEIPVIASAQVGAPGVISAPRGGVVVGPGQFNGHRIVLDDALLATPVVHGSAWLQDIVGVLDYRFGNYKLLITQPVAVVANALTRTAATPDGAGRIGVASYNLRNLGGQASEPRIQAIASHIADALGAPHIVALQEVQDNSGATNDGIVAADLPLGRLVAALDARTTRRYRHVSIDPIDGADGGQPGSNIRQAFLYDSARVMLSGLPLGGALEAIDATAGPDGTLRLSLGVGRIDPADRAFVDSRKPLVALFMVDGQPLVVVNNHFTSKGADQPLFGVHQPPQLASEKQRHRQAQRVGRFAERVLAIDPDIPIIVTGDLNDFWFADTLAPLRAAGLSNLTDTLAAGERYSYNHEGNLQALDHMFVSPGLLARGDLRFEFVRLNAEFSDAVSDHDPALLRLSMPPRIAAPASRAPASMPHSPAPGRASRAAGPAAGRARPAPAATRPGRCA